MTPYKLDEAKTMLVEVPIVLICNNCKEYWVAPMSNCTCGSSSLTVTHEANIIHVAANRQPKQIPAHPSLIEWMQREGKEVVCEGEFELKACCEMQCDGTCEQHNGTLTAYPLPQTEDDWDAFHDKWVSAMYDQSFLSMQDAVRFVIYNVEKPLIDHIKSTTQTDKK